MLNQLVTLQDLVKETAKMSAEKLMQDGWLESRALVMGTYGVISVPIGSEEEVVEEKLLDEAKEMARQSGAVIYVTMARFHENNEKGILVMGYTPFEAIHILVPVEQDDEDESRYIPDLSRAKLGIAEDAELFDPWLKNRKLQAN